MLETPYARTVHPAVRRLRNALAQDPRGAHETRLSLTRHLTGLTALLACLCCASLAIAQTGGGSGGGGGSGSGGGAGSGAISEKLANTVASLRGRKAIGNIPGLAPTVSAKPATTVEYILDEQSDRLRLRLFRYRFWANASVQRQTNKRGDDSEILGLSFGGHVPLGRRHVLGAVVLIDKLDTAFNDGRAQGAGWLVGPYVAGRDRRTKLTYDLALLIGTGTSTLDPAGTGTEDVTAERVLMTGGVARRIDFGAARVIPSLRLKYSQENWPEFTDPQSQVVASKTYEFLETRANLKAEYFLGNRRSSARLDAGISLTRVEDLEPVAKSSTYGTAEVGTTIPITRTAGFRATLKEDRIGDDRQSETKAQVRLFLRF